MAIGDTDTLRNKGWTDPLKESPIDPPDGWHHGGVRHTGGGIYCRSWFSVPTPTNIDLGEHYYEVTYGDEFRGVSLEKYVRQDDGIEFDGVIKERHTDDHTDTACAEVALELMQSVDPEDSNN